MDEQRVVIFPSIINRNGGPWVRGKRKYGSAMSKGESLFWGSRSNSFGGNILLE